MARFLCSGCGKRFGARSRKPGGRVHCPKCRALAYTYRKPLRPMGPDVGEVRDPE